MLISFFIYLACVLGIGLWAARTQKKKTSGSSFIVGGRTLNYWVTALSAHASDMSQWLFMGYPAVVYAHGMIEAWTALGLIAGMFLTWHFIAPALRRETEKYDVYTLSSFFEKRFHDTSGLIRILSALICLFFFTIYIASGLKAFGYLLSSAFGLNYYVGASIGIIAIILYTFTGGFVSVAWTDSFQALFLLATVLITPLVAYFSLDGISSIVDAAATRHINLSLVPDFSLNSLRALANPFAWMLGYFGMPHILSKFMGAANPNELYKAKYVGMAWQILALSAATAVGLIGIAFFNSLAGQEELIFINMAQQLFAPWFAGFVLTGILAAIVSTMDSQILVVAGVIAEDFYRRLMRQNASDRHVLMVYRGAIAGVALIALAIAFNQTSSIYELVHYAWSGLGCSFGPLVILSLYGKNINRYGALSGMICGSLTAALWPWLDKTFFQTGITEMLPGFLVGLLSIIVISRLTQPSEKLA